MRPESVFPKSHGLYSSTAMAQKLNSCAIWGAELIAIVRFVKFGTMWEFCSKNWIRCKIVGTLTKKVRFATQTTHANLTQFISRARQEWSELAEISLARFTSRYKSFGGRGYHCSIDSRDKGVNSDTKLNEIQE